MGAKVGSGIGFSVGVVAISGAVAFIFWGRKRKTGTLSDDSQETILPPVCEKSAEHEDSRYELSAQQAGNEISPNHAGQDDMRYELP